MYGLDISKYQAKIDLSRGNYDFAIIKATEGVGYTDPSFKNFSDQLTKLDKLMGCYHFARPDLHGTIYDMEREGDYFSQVIKDNGLKGKVISVLDWEREPMDRPDLIEAWVDKVEEELETTVVIYGSRSKLNKWKDYEVIKTHPIWMAVWPNPKRYVCGVDPHLPYPSSKVDWIIWQYSSTGSYPEFSGDVDLDYCKLTPEQWNLLIGEAKKKEKDLSDDMKWAVENGLIYGYGDGRYGENDLITRGQVASLFRRYTELLNKGELK